MAAQETAAPHVAEVRPVVVVRPAEGAAAVAVVAVAVAANN